MASTYVQQQVTLGGFGRGLFAPDTFDIIERSKLMRVLSAPVCTLRLPELPLESSQFCAEQISGFQCPVYEIVMQLVAYLTSYASVYCIKRVMLADR